MSTGFLLLSGAAALSLAIGCGRWLPRLWLGLTSFGAGAGFVAALRILFGRADWEWRSAFTLGGEFVHARLDGLSALFLALVAVVGACGAVYSRAYWGDAEKPTSAPRGRVWWTAIVLCMALVLTMSNGLHFLIAWELFAICGYFLIALDNDRAEVRSAGWLYLAASHVGTLGLFAFFSLLASRTGSWDLGPMRDQAGLAPLFWIALLGFGVKAGVFPLHVWLPSAHANAPSHVSGILSGVAIKMGVYGILRFSGWLPVPAGAGWVVIALGAVSALFGIAFALGQNDLKRLLAYCSVENIGIIMIGLGGALLASTHGEPAWGRLMLAGALLHVWNHGAFKSLLFLGAGSVLHGAGTREMSRLGGLWKRMPWTAAFWGLGAAAVSGLPPLNGFVSEWLIYLGLFGAAAERGSSTWAAAPVAIVMAVAGALALASFVKASSVVFLGAPRTTNAAEAHESAPLMRAPMAALAAVCAAIGLVPVLFWPAAARAAQAWKPAALSDLPPPPLIALGLANVLLAALAVAAAFVLFSVIRTRGTRRALTWDCGFAAPTARIQYTSGSFAEIATRWFFWLLRPETAQKRPRGPLPRVASRLERVPETVLEKGVGPVAGAIMALSTGVRRLQHGRLQAYILYLLAGLTALGLIVLLGGLL